ncbi:BLUF domain-containing protein [Hymenobacter sp. 5516J-16]|uniref:BLUF domain-containing protein n=1 Tax=Hymenobacter sp. 5516J-16 TaxID=2932253 RepID=UPI0021D4774D|nr:BLUF domain-containing protein [Hymenobacter sp. 5516J-16]
MSLLHHLIYQSNVVARLSASELGRLLEQCRSHNQQADITGVLLHDGNRFLGVLEGTPAAIAAVFNRIEADCRHTGVQVLADGPISHRQFACWTMGLVDDVSQPGGGVGDEAIPCMHTVTDAALWLLLREFQVGAGRPLLLLPS